MLLDALQSGRFVARSHQTVERHVAHFHEVVNDIGANKAGAAGHQDMLPGSLGIVGPPVCPDSQIELCLLAQKVKAGADFRAFLGQRGYQSGFVPPLLFAPGYGNHLGQFSDSWPFKKFAHAEA